jgi:glycosyltransferase involved in cell wall biosynthesis
MNIVFVNSTRKWGGVKTWTVDYATWLKDHGHIVRVYGRQSEFVDKLKRAGVDAFRMDFGFDYNPVTITRFLKDFSINRPDVVIGNITKEMNTAGVAARLLGIPNIQRVGLPADMNYSLRLKMLHKITRPWFLCPSQSVHNGLLKHLPYIEPERVKIIQNAKHPVEGVKPLEDGPLRLVSTSQVNADKGHEQVLEALAGIPQGKVEYHIVGTGKLEQQLREKYAALEQDGKVVWHGFSTDVAGHLTKADVFLLPSVREGMPNALLEAMSAGLAPVSRRVGGVADIWPESLSRFLLPMDAGVQEFREVLDELLAMSSDELIAMKEASLAACRDNFNLNTNIQAFVDWVQKEIL